MTNITDETKQIHRDLHMLADHLSDVLSGTPEVQQFCDTHARIDSGTVTWTHERFEQMENTPTYNMYWERLVHYRALVVSALLQLELNLPQRNYE